MNYLLENFMFTNNENRYLSPFACLSTKTRGRVYKDDILILGRSEFQRDRDRIIHSNAFRRLKHKTQVFVNTIDDHYRTRITHSIEVAQIARTISNFLNLNDDLAETLSLAHDLGHPPFGHAGEDMLNECMINHGGFNHNLQTLRIVLYLENKYFDFKGLNLTIDTLDGLIKHNGPIINETKGLKSIDGISKLLKKIRLSKYPSLEAQISSISDNIAYNNHDIQDGLYANIFDIKDLLEINFFKEIYFKNKNKFNGKNKNVVIFQIVRDSINLMVKDLINNSINNLKNQKIKKISDIYNARTNLISFSKKFLLVENEIKSFLKHNMYNNKDVLKKNNNGKKILNYLFDYISKKPNKFIKTNFMKKNKFRSVSDYISGMTDRYAIDLYKKIK